jgi:hypothetical protein
MRLVKCFIVATCLLALLTAAATQASPSLESIDNDIALLEAEAELHDDVLTAAQSYANTKLAAAQEQSRNILAAAAAEGAKEGDAAGPAPLPAASSKPVLSDAEKLKIQQQAAADAAKVAAAQAAKDAAIAAAKKAARRAKRLASSAFASAGMKHDANGVFGGIDFGIPKADAIPSTKGLKKAAKRSALERYSKYGPKRNIYGRKKSCLKDIAAHFDEKDIYETKKFALLQQMDKTKSRAHATQIRSKLANLESWHQLMQKKFMQSAAEAKQAQKKLERLFDAHLPQELKDQLQQNKVAKRAAQKIPFPDAMERAMAYLRSKRSEIQRDERLQTAGHKRMLRPEIRDKGFPSMDPISSLLREKLWRNVNTENEWSTDKGEMERAEGIVTAAHKAHGDFVEGPIAAPLLKGKLYTPETEKLGVPNFLHYFPWPKKPEEKVTMDDKVKVEQTYHQTW